MSCGGLWSAIAPELRDWMEGMRLQMGGLYRLSWRMMNRILSPRDLIFPAGSVDFLVLAEVCLILRNNLTGQVGSSILHIYGILCF